MIDPELSRTTVFGLDIGDDQGAVAIGLGLGLIDREAQLVRRDACAAGEDRIELQSAGIENQRFPALASLPTVMRLVAPARPKEACTKIAAGLELEHARAAMGGSDQRQFAVAAGFGFEDPPDQAAGDVGRLVGELGGQRHLAFLADAMRLVAAGGRGIVIRHTGLAEAGAFACGSA